MVTAFRSKIALIAFLFLVNFHISLVNCNRSSKEIQNIGQPFVIVLGITQDGGYPQAGTKKSEAWDDLSKRRPVAGLAIVDPKTYDFLSNNGPGDLLVRLKNIELRLLSNQASVKLNDKISITPLLVPHRAEYTETVGYRVDGPTRSVLFIPDIDKWEDWDQWGTHIEDLIRDVDIAYLDGTFYADGEIPGRSMYDIPHPFIEESMKRFRLLPLAEKKKIGFIHFHSTTEMATVKALSIAHLAAK